MPIDLEKAEGAKLPASEGSWSQDDVILYHLGVGAGVPASRQDSGRGKHQDVRAVRFLLGHTSTVR